MILLPAIDLMGGQVVRLRQGRASEKTVYSGDPAGVAKKWEAEGGGWLHIVDLDAAFSGDQQNLESVRQITAAVSIPCELGGGIRDAAAVERAFVAGVARVVIGTSAAGSPGFVKQMAAKYGADRIAVGIDARNGIVSVKGWTESSGLPALDFAKRMEQEGAGTVIYTDIATDGMLQGPNFAEIEKLLQAASCRVIASGGVSRLEDVLRLAEYESAYPALHGVIIGKALYDETIRLPDLKLALCAK